VQKVVKVFAGAYAFFGWVANFLAGALAAVNLADAKLAAENHHAQQARIVRHLLAFIGNKRLGSK